MGLSYATIKLSNEPLKLAVELRALVDTGALFMCVPAAVAAQLGFDATELRRRMVTLADGTTREVPVAAPVTIEFENRWCVSEALVLGDEAIIGCIPMEAMDVIVDPRTQRMTVNPQHPHFSVSLLK